jgi:hypothetical protein
MKNKIFIGVLIYLLVLCFGYAEDVKADFTGEFDEITLMRLPEKAKEQFTLFSTTGTEKSVIALDVGVGYYINKWNLKKPEFYCYFDRLEYATPDIGIVVLNLESIAVPVTLTLKLDGPVKKTIVRTIKLPANKVMMYTTKTTLAKAIGLYTVTGRVKGEGVDSVVTNRCYVYKIW